MNIKYLNTDAITFKMNSEWIIILNIMLKKFTEILELLEDKTRENIEIISFNVTQKEWSMKEITDR